MVEGVHGVVRLLHALEGVGDVVVDRQLPNGKKTEVKTTVRTQTQNATHCRTQRGKADEGRKNCCAEVAPLLTTPR